jgi:hypothetical protein
MLQVCSQGVDLKVDRHFGEGQPRQPSAMQRGLGQQSRLQAGRRSRAGNCLKQEGRASDVRLCLKHHTVRYVADAFLHGN